MKFTSTFTLATLLSIAAAAKTFGVVSIRSGSQFQYAELTQKSDSVFVGKTGDAIKFVLNDDGSLVDSSTNKYVVVGDDKKVSESDKADGSKWSVDDNRLKLNDKEYWYACEDGSNYKLSTGDCGTGIALHTVDEKEADEVKPGEKKENDKDNKDDKKDDKEAADLTAVEFDVAIIRSGSKFQYANLKAKDGKVYVGGNVGETIKFVRNNDGTIGDANTGLFVSRNGDSELEETDGNNPTTMYISEGYLYVQDEKDTPWVVCPIGNEQYQLKSGGRDRCEGGTDVVLRVGSQKDAKPVKPVEVANNGKFKVFANVDGKKIPIIKSKDHPWVYTIGGEGEELQVTDKVDGTIQDWDGNYVTIQENGDIGAQPNYVSGYPSERINLRDNEITVDGQNKFNSCPTDQDSHSLTTNSYDGCQEISLSLEQI
ncbi:hypothetical protein DICA2_E30922 [Diutina catenulata]